MLGKSLKSIFQFEKLKWISCTCFQPGNWLALVKKTFPLIDLHADLIVCCTARTIRCRHARSVLNKFLSKRKWSRALPAFSITKPSARTNMVRNIAAPKFHLHSMSILARHTHRVEQEPLTTPFLAHNAMMSYSRLEGRPTTADLVV